MTEDVPELPLKAERPSVCRGFLIQQARIDASVSHSDRIDGRV